MLFATCRKLSSMSDKVSSIYAQPRKISSVEEHPLFLTSGCPGNQMSDLARLTRA